MIAYRREAGLAGALRTIQLRGYQTQSLAMACSVSRYVVPLNRGADRSAHGIRNCGNVSLCLDGMLSRLYQCSHSSVRRSVGLDPGDQHEGRQKRSLDSHCSDPSEWWTIGLDKRSSHNPDFWQKKIRVPLWLTQQQKPSWVNSRLVTLDAQRPNGLDGNGPCCSKSYGSVSALERLSEVGQVEKALDVMDQHSTIHSVRVYRSLLKTCAERKALALARRVRAHLATQGLLSNSFLGEYVVSTLVQCGGLEDALHVFHSLTKRTAFSWTAIISGYTMAGQSEKALRMSNMMLDGGVEPNKYTLVSLLRACGSLRDLQEGKRFHDVVSRYRYESDLFVGTSLVDMYGKCGSIVDAQQVFDGLSQRDVVSWTAILSAYVQQDQAERTSELYERMLAEGVTPNNRTFVIVLQACGLLAEKEEDSFVDGQLTKVISLHKGKAIHADAEMKGHDSDVFVASTLISMYAKCGSIVDAQNVFDGLSHHDVVSWTAILAAYAQQGQGVKVLQLYEEMWEEGVHPNARSFVIALQACSLSAEQEEHVVVIDGQSVKAKYLGKGKVLHADAVMQGCHSDVFVGSTLINMYRNCGSIVDAENTFEKLTEPNVVTWNAMLMAYAKQSQAEKALKLYEHMREKGVTPDIRTFVSMLQLCAMLADKEGDVVIDGQSARVTCLEKGKAIHADAWRREYDSDAFLNSTLISMYGRCGSIVDALQVFQGLCHQDVVSWNAMLAVLVEQRQLKEALQLYKQMQMAGVSPDDWTFASAFQACGMLAVKEQDLASPGSARLKCLEMAKALHACCRRKCYDKDVFVGRSLIDMYGKCGSTVDAQFVFDGIMHKSVVAWTALLSAYVEDGNGRKAFQLYRQMQVEGVCPDDIALVCILQACSSTGNLDICRYIHITLVSRENLSALVANALIHAYGRCGSMVDAQIVFDALPKTNVVSWTTLIAGYARQGDCLGSLQCYEEMRLAGVKPNEVTFLALLSACSHAGLVQKGVDYFHSMSSDHGISPNIEHYVSLVDLLGRAGHFLQVKCLLSTMPLVPNLSMWLCLLSACRTHSNVVLARYAFNQAVHLQPKNSAPYVLMSNIYSHAGLRKSLQEVIVLEQQAGAWKTPGQCWIEHRLTVYTFGVRDHNHPQLCDYEGFYHLLRVLSSELEGYGSNYQPHGLVDHSTTVQYRRPIHDT